VVVISSIAGLAASPDQPDEVAAVVAFLASG
jgi:hypothetical protein